MHLPNIPFRELSSHNNQNIWPLLTTVAVALVSALGAFEVICPLMLAFKEALLLICGFFLTVALWQIRHWDQTDDRFCARLDTSLTRRKEGTNSKAECSRHIMTVQQQCLLQNHSQVQDLHRLSTHAPGTKLSSVPELSIPSELTCVPELNAPCEQQAASTASSCMHWSDSQESLAKCARPRSKALCAQTAGQLAALPHGCTSVVLRGIAKEYTPELFVARLHACGYQGEIDLVYLPRDFKKDCNMGFAIANFRTPDAASRFAAEFHLVDSSTKFPDFKHAKVCEVSPAATQGFDENVQRLQNGTARSLLKGKLAWQPLLIDNAGTTTKLLMQ